MIKRKCLKCGKSFKSRHNGHRVCHLCAAKNDGIKVPVSAVADRRRKAPLLFKEDT